MFLLEHATYVHREAPRYTASDLEAAWKSVKGHGFSEPDVLKANVAFGNTATGIKSRQGLANLVPPVDDASQFSTSFEAAAAESHTIMVDVVQQVLDKAGLTAADIDILVTTGSSFHPVPSLASMLVNHFRMKQSVKSLHLGCMACSAGAIGINVVQDLLKATPSSVALFVAHENATKGFYKGRDPNKLLANMLFGPGGAAILLTNKRSLARRAKYQLLESVRVHVGQDDIAYRSMGIWESDEAGEHIRYNSDVPRAASMAIKAAIAQVAPKVMSWSQIVAAGKSELVRKLRGKDAAPQYVPSFSEGVVDHFLLHPGSHGMLKGFMKGLGLTVENTLPSAAALRDYGNTSSASTYYVLAYLESLVGVKKGQRLMQVSVGTGVKAGVNVWRCLRDVKETHPAWEHLGGVPITEQDLVLPLRTVKGLDDHADVAETLNRMAGQTAAAAAAVNGQTAAGAASTAANGDVAVAAAAQVAEN